MVPIFGTKTKKLDFEEEKINKRFSDRVFVFLTSKEPLTLSLICIK